MSSLGDLYTHLKNLCEQWFYNKSQIDTALNGKISKSNTVGLVKNDGSIDTTNYSTFSGDYDDLTDKPTIPTKTSDLTNDGDGTNVFVKNNDSRLSDARTPTSHSHGSGMVTDTGTYPNINNAFPNQHSINEAIDTKLGQLSDIDAIKVVSTLPTASSSTMGKLYIISENSKINVYYTEQDGSSYSWHEMDADILDDLSIDWSDIQNNPFSSASPSDYAISSHSHGYINNDGTGANPNNTDANASMEVINLPDGYRLVDRLLFADSSDGNKIKYTMNVPSQYIKNIVALANIGTSANATQFNINGAIDTALGGKANTSDLGAVALSNSYDDLDDLPSLFSGSYDDLTDVPSTFTPSSHNHNYILNNGTITQTVTNNGKLVVTNSSNQVGVESVIDVLDGVINNLIDYGDS